jgi:hypothetical protein
MVDLGAGEPQFRDDRGGADPDTTAALEAFEAGRGTEHEALRALAGSRLLVPVVAVRADELAAGDGAEGEPAGTPAAPPAAPADAAASGEKATEMAMPAIVGRDGRRALPAFTSLNSLAAWQTGARPVPVPAASVWQSAVRESCAVVIDIAGPVPLVVEGSRLATLAAGGPAPALHEDPDAWQAAAAAASEMAPGVRVRLTAPRGGLDFTLEIAPPAGDPQPVPSDVADRIADAVKVRLGARARSGFAVVLPNPAASGGQS